MAAWTNATPTSAPAGVLRPDELARWVRREQRPYAGPAGQWIEAFWALSWQVPPGREHTAMTLPSPAVHLTVERGDTRREVGADPFVLTGLPTRRFEARLAGTGSVLGLKLRPGGLTALLGVPAYDWTDRTLRAAPLLPAAVAQRWRALRADDDWAWTVEVERLVLGLAATAGPDPEHEALLAVVADLFADRRVTGVEEVAERHATTVRTLQRRFRHYVGVGPRWLLRRYRMHDALEALHAGYDGPIADLAHEHGWYDQAHFAREFSSLVGQSPGAYARALRGRDR